MTHPVRISMAQMAAATDADQERNIYLHPNPLARDIFWQRLDALYDLLARHADPDDRVLDFGGGSGGFVQGLNRLFKQADLVDLDPQDAARLVAQLGLERVHVMQRNINDFHPEEPYDTVILADVLEHFADLSVPVDWLRQHLHPDRGQLFVSLPTEN